jgi:hypothetical protein
MLGILYFTKMNFVGVLPATYGANARLVFTGRPFHVVVVSQHDGVD